MSLQRLQLVVSVITAIALTYIAYNQLCIAREGHAMRKAGIP